MFGFLILQISTRSSWFCRQSMQAVTDFLWIIMPPFLSISGFKGQLKSPPIMILSSDSKFSFCSVPSKLLKNDKISLYLFGAYKFFKTYVLSLITALRMMKLPKGSRMFWWMVQSKPFLIKIETPRALELLWLFIISAPHSFFRCVSVFIVEWFLVKKLCRLYVSCTK